MRWRVHCVSENRQQVFAQHSEHHENKEEYKNATDHERNQFVALIDVDFEVIGNVIPKGRMNSDRGDYETNQERVKN